MAGKRNKSHPKESVPATEVKGGHGGVPIWVVSLIVAIPIAVVALFWQFSGAFNVKIDPAAETGASKGHSNDELKQMANQLAARVESNPDDVQGMATLARTYYSLGDYSNAAKVYARLVKAIPDDATILADYADSLAVSNGNNLSGEPMALIERALKVDPTYWKALAMAATEAFRRKDYKTAVANWEKSLAGIPPDAGDLRNSIQDSLNNARELAGKR